MSSENSAAAAAADASKRETNANAKVSDTEAYRKQDDVVFAAKDGAPIVVACVHAGKVAKQRKAAIGATHFWLTCTRLNNLLGRFERNGAIKALTELMTSNKELATAHVASHDAYVALVTPRLDAKQKEFFLAEFVINPDKRKFGNPAVCGAQDMKCIHALTAGALAGDGNPIGCAIMRYVRFLATEARTSWAQGPDGAVVSSLAQKYVDDFGNFMAFAEKGGAAAWAPLDMDAEEAAELDLSACATQVLTDADGRPPKSNPRKKNRLN